MENFKFNSEQFKNFSINQFGKPVLLKLDDNIQSKGISAFAAIPWSFIAKELAKGMIAKLGGEILGSLLKETGLPISELINLMILELRSTLESVLIEFDLNQMSREFSSLLTSMEEYGISGGLFRLENADLRVNYLISGFQSYGDLATNLYIAAIALKVNILQAFTQDNHRDETANLKLFAFQKISELEKIREKVETVLELEFSGSDFRAIHQPRDGGYYEFGYDENNVFIFVTRCYPSQVNCMREAREQVKNERKRRIESRYKEILEPIDLTLKALREQL